MSVCQIEQEMHHRAICIDQNRFHPTIDCYEFCHFLTFFVSSEGAREQNKNLFDLTLFVFNEDLYRDLTLRPSQNNDWFPKKYIENFSDEI